MKYCSVILPLPLREPLTYIAEDAVTVLPGMRVMVPLGEGGRLVRGFVASVSDVRPSGDYALKQIVSVLDTRPVFDDRLLALAGFTAESYAATIGEALDAALPSGKSDHEPLPLSADDTTEHTLSSEQQQIFDEITATMKPGSLHLLYGVTGSGKTEVYLSLAERAVAEGKSALFLLPEISLSWQIYARVQRTFGSRAVLYHSGLTPTERMKNWLAFMDGTARIAVGTRSAVFMQCPSLGLIVLDEEHDHSYKEHSNPRYHAKRIAAYRAQQEGASVIYGSATPSAESYLLALRGKLGLHRLASRYGGAALPSISVVNSSGRVLTTELKNAVYETVKAGNQCVLLLNRRGHSPNVSCEHCGRSVECDDCSVRMTFHKSGKLICHYCGVEKPVPETCPHCGGPITMSGAGTQKAEERIAEEFRTLRLFRLDQDSARRKKVVPEMIERMKNGEMDVLLGTQLVSKGFDFHRVVLSAVISADIGLGVPDFRAPERVFALLMQLAGRSGRRSAGSVIIQTQEPDNPLFAFLKKHDYEGFIRRELSMREALRYPPFIYLLKILTRDPDEQKAEERSEMIAESLETQFGGEASDILGPAPAPIPKIGRHFRHQLIIKSSSRDLLVRMAHHVRFVLKPAGTEVDIDPVDMV